MQVRLCFIFIFICFSSNPSFGQELERFKEFFQTLQSPDSGLTPNIKCLESAKAEHCLDLAKAACTSSVAGNGRKQLEDELLLRFPENVPSTTFNTSTRKSAIFEAEVEVSKQIPVTRVEIVEFFQQIRNKFIVMVEGNPEIPALTKSEMKKNLNGLSLQDSQQYFDDQFKKMKIKYPDSTPKQLEAAAMRGYLPNCGPAGMYASAFVTDDKITLCPGLMLQSLDAGAKGKEEFLNSLTFLLGHEASHVIGVEAYPELYAQMGECFNKVTNNPEYWSKKGEEAAADYWASRVFSQQLAQTGTSNLHALKSVVHNFGSLCGLEMEDMYPSTSDRMNLILGRNPVMREVLGCEGPSKERPVCGINGLQH